MKRKLLALAVLGLPVVGHAADAELDTIIVTATRIPQADTTAPYASEVHGREQIEQSGAATLFDYLAQYSSLRVMPSYGNRFTPKLDMRGYGIGDGYQNIVVTLDGRRMNNIDMVPQLLGSIPLVDIDRIEITKGSGSVIYGDGATAGSIQIYTRPHTGVGVQVSAGNHGLRSGSVAAGAASERFNVSASADYMSQDGFAEPDVTGRRDSASNRTLRGKLEARPVERLKLDLEAASTDIDTRYPGPMTLAEFKANPAQSSGNTYTHQVFESDLWRVGGELELSRAWKLLASHGREDKLSNYVTYRSASNYDYASDDVAVQYRGGTFDLSAGMQGFDGTRIGASNRTRKNNTGWYAQGQYRLERYTLSGGVRFEQVDYSYAPKTGTALRASHDLTAWDIGVNRQMDERLSVFADYNRAFQAPDIDRFFSGGAFNAFIAPAKSRTLSIGLNHVGPANRLKLALFHARLDDEIYYYNTGNWLSSYNTNLDKSHKYGLELQDSYRFSERIGVRLGYHYTHAVVDRENDGGGAYNGKDLPGVPRHGVTLGLSYAPSAASSLNLTQTWRSQAYAANDFANGFSQKQGVYQSTDLAYRYRQKGLEWFAAVENLFEHKNGLWIKNDSIYPVNFSRNVRVGIKAAF